MNRSKRSRRRRQSLRHQLAGANHLAKEWARQLGATERSWASVTARADQAERQLEASQLEVTWTPVQ